MKELTALHCSHSPSGTPIDHGGRIVKGDVDAHFAAAVLSLSWVQVSRSMSSLM